MLYVGWGMALLALLYAIWSDHKRRAERESVHGFLESLKPSVSEVPNTHHIIASINVELARLKPE